MLISEALKASGHEGKVKIAMDCAASEFCEGGVYDLAFKAKDNDGSQKKSGADMAAFYAEISAKYPIISIEVRTGAVRRCGGGTAAVQLHGSMPGGAVLAC